MSEQAMTTTQQKAIDLRNYLNGDRVKAQIAAALPKWLSPDRFLRVIFGAALRNPKILECSVESILQSVMMCAQLGLEPILGRAHLVPYWNGKKRCLECQFQPGYQGLTDLARRSGMIQDVYAQVVYEADHFEIEYGTSRRLSHKPTLNGDPGKPIGAYAVWEFKDGTKTFEFMPMRDIEKRRAVSQSYTYAETGDPNKGGGKQDSVWHTWLDDQMRKTVVKHSAKLVPLSIEFMETVQVDNAAEIGQRVTMFQGVPMIEQQDSADPGLTAAEPVPPWSEAIQQTIDSAPEAFERFVAATIQANRTSEGELRMEANKDPDRFLAAYLSWFQKQQYVLEAMKRTGIAHPMTVDAYQENRRERKPRSDKGQPRRPAPAQPDPPPTPGKAQDPPAEEPPPPPAQLATDERAPGDEPPPLSEELLLDERRAELAELEKTHKYFVLEAKKRTGIAHPMTIDAYDELIRQFWLIRNEKSK